MYGPDKADSHLVDHMVNLGPAVIVRTRPEDIVCTRRMFQRTRLHPPVIATGKRLGELGQEPRSCQ